MSSMPFVSSGTRSLANEINATVCPSELIAGATLFPFAAGGEVPVAWLATTVVATQAVPVAMSVLHVFRMKMFSTPLAVLVERFDACEAKATNCPEPLLFRLMLGFSLKPFPGEVPFGVDTRYVEGMHVVVVTVASMHVSRT